MFHFKKTNYGPMLNICIVCFVPNVNTWFRQSTSATDHNISISIPMHDSPKWDINSLSALQNQAFLLHNQGGQRNWCLTSAWCSNKIFIVPYWPCVAAICNSLETGSHAQNLNPHQFLSKEAILLFHNVLEKTFKKFNNRSIFAGTTFMINVAIFANRSVIQNGLRNRVQFPDQEPPGNRRLPVIPSRTKFSKVVGLTIFKFSLFLYLKLGSSENH